MKRIFLVLVALLLLLIAGVAAAWFLLFRSSVQLAQILPSDTVLLAHIPNGALTGVAYQNSKLKKVLESEELQGLMAMAMAEAMKAMPEEQRKHLEEAQALAEMFKTNLSGECFIAVLDVNMDEPSENGVLFGLRPIPGLGNMDAFVSKVKEKVKAALEDQETGTATYGGVKYEWIQLSSDEIDADIRLCQGTVAGWNITAIGEAALKQFIDRANRPSSPSLQDNLHYKAIETQIGPGNNAKFYLSFDRVLEKVFEKLEDLPEFADEASLWRDLYGPMSAFGAGMKFKGNGDIEDTWVTLMPKDKRPNLGAMFEPCAFKTLKYTSPNTILYTAQNIDWKKYWDYIVKLYSSSPELSRAVEMVPGIVNTVGLDWNKNILEAIGPEVALQVDWPSKATIPIGGIYLQVANEKNFKPVIDFIVKSAAEYRHEQNALGTWMDLDVKGTKLKVFRLIQPPDSPAPPVKVAPTMIVSGDMFGVFISEEAASSMLLADAKGVVTQQESFKSLGLSTAGASSLIYVDMQKIVGRTYSMAAPMVKMAAMFSPELAPYVEQADLPEKLSFSDELGSWTMTGVMNNDGGVARSVSSVGNLIFPLAFTAGASAAVLQGLGAKVPGAVADDSGASSDPKSAEAVRDELGELREIITAWSAADSVPTGTAVEWVKLQGYFIPGSRLEQSGGRDALGNPYVLGVVGERVADVAPETKNAFPDRDDTFWTQP
jgi:hypothetical protein